ncbi:centromere-associated protein E-like isoform X2 [Coccinella septempunctata]|nr:centromere-associated protein E-like isoform X2 [Coccinella septempunctata]XP_044764311.1 centromere-associated protein E-like isoform X2 [Coccinella septempunctata]
MATEKSSLALKLGEQKGQIHSLQHQIENLKMYQEQSNLQLEQLTEENTALRNRLRDVAHSPLSDNEKQQLLYESHRHHNSAPASIATNPMEDGTCGDVTACPTPDWDKHSSSNVSEISVACLQDKINQMQETHYSTNEELQATLQELTDLQRQLTELQQENERLVEEKNLMFDSLCRQTERLKDTRHEVESLKTVLYREKNEPGIETAQEREEKLVDLLKSAQDEHESLISKHEQLSGELQELREANDALHEQLKVVTERNGTLESTLDAKQAEHKLLDQELTQARDQCSGNQIEINRLKDLLENARTKINELEQDRALSDKSELDELLDNARKEKDALESEVAHLKEQLARSKNEIEKLKEQVSILQEECKVIRNNARTIQSDLEYKYEKLASEKSALTEQLHKFQDIINELQVQAQCQEEDKRNLSDVLAETQRNLSESERKIAMLENELADVKKLRKEENEEWEKFQNDLLTSVRVANDFKTEAQQDLQKMIMENKEHRDKVRLLEAQLDKLKGDPAMPEDRRSSQPYRKQNASRRIFGSLPNLLETPNEQTGKSTKRPKWARHQKQLSQGEEKILESLHKMYHEIDPDKPDHMLTSEQAVVKKLKSLYENDGTKYKPVAPRRKQELAISKPLLESVYSNPKLESIAKNPDLRCLDTDRFSWMGHRRFSDDNSEPKPSDNTKGFVSYLQDSPRTSNVENQRVSSMDEHTDHPLKRYSSKEDLTELGNPPDTKGSLQDRPPRTSSINHHRVSSLDNPREFPLRRYSSKEDLTGIAELEAFKPPSNKRSSLKSFHSDSSSNVSQRKRVSFDDKRNSCVVIKEFLSFESLEDIYKGIDPKVPEEQLTKEQRFAVRLKTSMENLGRKPELRKRPTFKRSKVTISSPLKASVLKNTKLLSIIKDPIVRTAGEDVEQETVELRKVHRMKKYLTDVNRVLRYPSRVSSKKDSRLSKSMEDVRDSRYVFKRISSSMENLPSEGGVEPKIEIKVVTKVLPAMSFAASFNVSSSSSSVDNSAEDLAGNREEAQVVFIEHFESEKKSSGLDVGHMEEGVKIEDISENFRRSSVGVDDDGYTGRISFPVEEEEDQRDICRMRLLSINSIEMEEEDDVLARYKRISEYKEEDSNEESYEDTPNEEDNQSFYSVELKVVADEAKDSNVAEQEDWLTKYLDQTCDEEEIQENRKMRVLYMDVVKEIKRKYSQDLQQSSSESSDEEDVHIFNAREGTIEVRRSKDDGGNFFDRFFKTKLSLDKEPDNVGVEEDLKENLKDSERFHPTKEEMEYIRRVREMYKEEFEDVDKLGTTDVESDRYRKFLCRQNALDSSSVPGTFQEGNKSLSGDGIDGKGDVVLSQNEMKLLSSVRKRLSRPLSDINVDDLAFIESMKDKYLRNNNDEAPDPAVTSEHPLEDSGEKPITSSEVTPIYGRFYLRYLTENFLIEERKQSFRQDPHLNPGKTSTEDYILRHSTENFLEEERNHSVEYRKRQYGCCEGQDRDPSPQQGSISNISKIVSRAITTYDDGYLKRITSNFLIEEINHNTFFELSRKRESEETQAGFPSSEPRSTSKTERSMGSEPLEFSGERSSTPVGTSSGRVGDLDGAKDSTDAAHSEYTSTTVVTLRNCGEGRSNSSKSTSWLYYQPVYANSQELHPPTPNNRPSKPRKPKPLPRKPSKDSWFRLTSSPNTDSRSSVSRTVDNVTVVQVENEPHEEPLPNFSEAMDEPCDVIETIAKVGKIQREGSEGSIAKLVDAIASSNVMVRKTKKFIKDGDQLEEFDEASGVYNVRIDEVLDNDKFDTRSQIIPEALIDYADSESKITLFDVDNDLSDFQEACSRPQTSRQRSTPFRLSYYGESSDEGVDGLKETAPRASKENVTRLKQKFENLGSDNDETERNSVIMREFREAQKTNLSRLLNEKAAYDLVFKTDSKHWFDNGSDDRPEQTFETNEKPLNITILDPVESKTNADYQHLFENSEASKGTSKKPFVGNVKLSELNLKTSIPCVDFTTLNAAMVERGSNASLFNFGLVNDATSSDASTASCAAAKDEW